MRGSRKLFQRVSLFDVFLVDEGIQMHVSLKAGHHLNGVSLVSQWWPNIECRLMVGQIYPTELQLNKANSSDTEAPCLDLNLSITNGIVSSNFFYKRDDFNFEIVIFPFLDGDVPRSPSYGVYISQLIRFVRVCSNVGDNRNLFLTAKLLKQGYGYHKIRKAFSKFYHRHSELIAKYNIG